MITRDKLLDYGIKTTQDGDDIFINNKKLSVSIATASISSMKNAFCIKYYNKGTPDDVETSALEDNDMSLEDIHKGLQDEISEAYIEMIETIDKDITKTKVF